MDKDKPHWFADHEQDDMRNFGDISKKLDALNAKIDPVIDAYTAATTLGKWTKASLGFVLLCFGVWAAIKNI